MFGKITGLRLLAYEKADSNVMSFSCIKYAITHVAERDTPAKQWTKTPPPR